LGEGTTFAIRLPATAEHPADRRSTLEASPRPSQSGVTVLLVEDDGGVRHLIRHMLLKGGYTVYETSEPREAARICETVPIDLLLTDIIMPDINGRDLAASLSEIHKELRVLYMSGYIDDSILPSSFMEPGFHFIRKPFTSARLYRQIEAIFNARPQEPPDRAIGASGGYSLV
jgi:DNA-binding NtrC family response regulator